MPAPGWHSSLARESTAIHLHDCPPDHTRGRHHLCHRHGHRLHVAGRAEVRLGRAGRQRRRPLQHLERRLGRPRAHDGPVEPVRREHLLSEHGHAGVLRGQSRGRSARRSGVGAHGEPARRVELDHPLRLRLRVSRHLRAGAAAHRVEDGRVCRGHGIRLLPLRFRAHSAHPVAPDVRPLARASRHARVRRARHDRRRARPRRRHGACRPRLRLLRRVLRSCGRPRRALVCVRW